MNLKSCWKKSVCHKKVWTFILHKDQHQQKMCYSCGKWCLAKNTQLSLFFFVWVLSSDFKEAKSLLDVNHKKSLLLSRIGSVYSWQDFLPFSISSKTHSHILSLCILYRISFFLCLICTSAVCSVIVSDKVF